MTPTAAAAAEVAEVARLLAENNRLRTKNNRLRAKVAQLTGALDSRILIEQAKGILSQKYGVDVDQGFEILRDQARSHHQDIHHLAAALVARQKKGR